MSVTDLPPPVAELLGQLGAAGFRPVSDVRGGMGGVRQVLRGPDGAEVEVSGDRGTWMLLLGVAGQVGRTPPEAWIAHLDGGEVQAPDLDRQVAFLRDRWPEAVAAARADPGLDALLTRLGEDYMRRRLGGQGPGRAVR